MFKIGDLEVGQIHRTLNCGQYEITSIYSSLDIRVRFLDTGYKRSVRIGSINSGSIRDKYLPTVCGVGYLGDASMKEFPNEYARWKSMIERCYYPKHPHYENYGGAGVSVSEDWQCFETFAKEIKEIDGYFEGILDLSKEYHLDKDYKHSGEGVKMYSKETCIWTSSQRNNAKDKAIFFRASHPVYGETITSNVREWCRRTGHTHQRVYEILRKNKGTHFGWTFSYINEKRTIL